MATINSTIVLEDRFSGVIHNILNAVNMTVATMESMQNTMGNSFDTSALNGVHEQLNEATIKTQEWEASIQQTANTANSLSAPIEKANQGIRNNAGEQEKFNRSVNNGVSNMDGLSKKIKSVAATYLSLQSVKKVFEISDDFTQTTARVDMMNQAFNKSNGTAKKTDDLVNLIYQSAQNARGEFGDMADVVARFGNNAKDAFSSQEEVVAFSNLIQKQMTIAGASTQEASNAMLQLSQALGSGVLRGDELNSIFEQAPNLIQSIADYLNVPMGKIREMAADGKLSADVVKAAIFNSADEINAKFSEMPMTWGQVFTLMKNTALMQFQPVLDKVNELANNQQFQEFASNMIGTLAGVANVALGLFEIMASAGSFVVDNWSWIAPIFIGVATAIGAICTAKAIYNMITAISNTLDAISTARSRLKAGASLAEATATSTAAGAQVGLNAALLACPITWIILGIIAIIAIIFVVIGAINKAKGETTSALGVILGAIFWVGALIVDFVIGVINGIIQFFWTLFVEPFIGIIEFVLNAANGGFDTFGDGVANLIGQIISWFLSLGKVVTAIIDAIFGTDWTSGLSALQSKVTAWGTNEKAITISHEAPQIKSRIGLKDAYSKGYNVGSNFQDKLSGFFGGGLNTDNIFDGKEYAGDYDIGKIPSNIASTADNTGKTADSLEITSEDLKYLRDIAEKEVVNRFTTAEIKVEMNNNNNISSDMDLDGVIDYLTVGVNDAMAKAAEGVHA